MNKIFLIGRLTKDIEVRFTQNEKKIGNFTLAVNREYKNTNGEYETDFINCLLFTNVDTVEKYTKKGDLISVMGKLQNRSYEDKDGKKHYVSEVVADKVEFLQAKKETDPYVEMKQKVEFDESQLPF